jgi:hypothetical protein
MAQKRPGVSLSGQIELSIQLPHNLRGDISNRVKLIEDFLVSRAITADDRFNARVIVERAGVDCCVVELRRLDMVSS